MVLDFPKEYVPGGFMLVNVEERHLGISKNLVISRKYLCCYFYIDLKLQNCPNSKKGQLDNK